MGAQPTKASLHAAPRVGRLSPVNLSLCLEMNDSPSTLLFLASTLLPFLPNPVQCLHKCPHF